MKKYPDLERAQRRIRRGQARKHAPLMVNPGDYRVHTMALDTEEHGALILLMMFYAGAGWLPRNERQLARIARVMSIRRWRKMWPVLKDFVADGEDDLIMPLVDSWAAERAPRLDVALSEWGRLRLSVFQRDSFTCRYCGEAELTEPHCDHVVPVSQGGPSTLENLVTACGPCNIKKGARRPEEWLQ